ncbi:two-component sensor histidine kinase/CHASE1-domain containing sensor protein [Altererythrobacter atlanticus]|uniref:histidine kinase n=1 Tax=Croceibacterium atlanticum TaxID=1267766 RepID=A0A0F7KV38_9SPHN|nr:CHASE domain-containing protein [Croceibacterium atlanticum]AKH42625.1 Blue-light-activated histidine kinase 1 [Croceibacterium atlanticum]MBB5731402.1 two-component sensor histidine kinase/CHASE1-domain containing sensor protein [Croceibacterium atlanticum]
MAQASGKRSRTKRWLVRYPRALPTAIFLLVTATAVLSVFAIERGEDQRQAVQMRSRAMAIGSALERRANASSAYLRAGAALLASLDDVPASRFRRFVSELRLDADYRGAEGIGWAKVVHPDEIEAFDQQMAEEAPGRVVLHPRPSGQQPYSVPVTYLQPDTERNRRALGFDMFSEPVRRAAMIEAERTARPTASGKVVLQQEGNGEAPGFLIYMPVFEPAPGGRRLRGFIYSPFNAEDFLASALQLEGAGEFGVRLYSGQLGESNLLADTNFDPANTMRAVERISIANSPWVLEIDSDSGDRLSGLSILTLIFGLLVASLLMLLVRMLTQQALEDEEQLRWFEEQASIRNSLTRELNHRVKNTLANVLSIIALTRRRAESLDDFAASLDGRIRALSATHDLLTKSDWGTTPIRSVVDAELKPYSYAADHEIDLVGPEIELAPNDALSLGLAMHELATNAAKYGALSRPGGKVSVHWKLTTDALVRIEWKESGGPPVPQKRNRGFGTDLIERIVAHELDSPVELEFNPEGVRCVLTIPVRRRTEFVMRANRIKAGTEPPPKSGKD